MRTIVETVILRGDDSDGVISIITAKQASALCQKQFADRMHNSGHSIVRVVSCDLAQMDGGKRWEVRTTYEYSEIN